MGLVSKGSSLDLFDGVTRSQLDDFAIKYTHIHFVLVFFVFVPTIIRGKKHTCWECFRKPRVWHCFYVQHLQTTSWKCSKTFHGKQGLKKKGAFSGFCAPSLSLAEWSMKAAHLPGKPQWVPVPEEHFIFYFAALLLWAPERLELVVTLSSAGGQWLCSHWARFTKQRVIVSLKALSQNQFRCGLQGHCDLKRLSWVPHRHLPPHYIQIPRWIRAWGHSICSLWDWIDTCLSNWTMTGLWFFLGGWG